MYEVTDKDGKFLYYRMTKRMKNEDGGYDVITARSKHSEKDCRKKLNAKIAEWSAKHEEEKINGVYSTMKLGNYAENWYNLTIKNANCSRANKENYKNQVFNHIIPKIGHIKLCDLTEDDCQQMLNEYAGWSKTLIDKIRMTLRRILRKAVKEGLIKRNVAEDIVRPEYTEGVRRPLTDQEQQWFSETSQKHYAGTMIMTMLKCGLRPIEIRRMKWDWIDFEKNDLIVKKSKTAAGTNRHIPIPPDLMVMLKKLKIKNLNNEYVFVKFDKHTNLDDNAFYQQWRNFIRECEIEHGAVVYRNQITKHVLADDLEPYLLRHTFCTNLQAAGIPLQIAKEYMGHSDISVTSKIYTHTTDEVYEMNRQRLLDYENYKKQQWAVV